MAADDFLDLGVAKFERVDHRFFGNFQRAGLHHDDGVFGAGNDDVHQAFLLVRDGGIGNQLAVEQADANRGDGLFKRQVRAITQPRKRR